jgi:membrane protease YdiL (CAAX protease family)
VELNPQSPAAYGAGAVGLALAFYSLYLFLASLPRWKEWLQAASRLPACPLGWADLFGLIAVLGLLIKAEAGLLLPAAVVAGGVLIYARHAMPAAGYWGMRGAWLPEALWAGGRLYLTAYFPFLVLAFGSLWIFEKCGYGELYQEPVRQFLETDNPSWLLVQALVLAPVGEEILFRGILFPLVREKWSMGGAAVATGLLFGAAHGHWPSFPVLAVLGALLALVYDRTGKLGYCMGLHFFFNLGTTVYLMALKYGGGLAGHAR